MAETSLPSVTAVIPAYNMAPFIERTLRSALAQTYPNLAILVVNDGSTDDTGQIVERIAREHDRISLVTTPNRGVAEARNLGTRQAETAYVAYLDGDDLWHPEKINRQVAALSAHSGDPDWAACYAFSRVIGEDDRVLGDSIPRELRGSFFEQHMQANPIGNGSSLLVTREAALAVGGFNPDLAARGIGGCEDVEFQLRLLLRFKIECVPEFLIGYRIHPRQMSGDVAKLRASEIAVFESVTREPGIGARMRERGLVNTHLIASKARLKLGDWTGAFDHLRQSSGISRSETSRSLARMTAGEVRYWSQRLAASVAGRPARPYIGKPFGEIDPAAGLGERWASAAQYRWTLLAGDRSLTQG